MLILVVGFTIHYLPYAAPDQQRPMAQMSTELEEAGWVAGLGLLRTLVRITLPVLLPTLIAGDPGSLPRPFANLTLPLLLSSPRTRTISMVVYDTGRSNTAVSEISSGRMKIAHQ